MEIGELISIYRKQAGMTIDELADKSGVPKGTINKIIGGVTRAPTLKNVRSIAYAMGKRLADFDKEPELTDFLNAEEQDMVKKYRALDSHGRKIVDLVLNEETARMKELAAQKQKPAPGDGDELAEKRREELIDCVGHLRPEGQAVLAAATQRAYVQGQESIPAALASDDQKVQ